MSKYSVKCFFLIQISIFISNKELVNEACLDYFSVFINNDTNIDSKMGGGSNLFGGRAAAPLAPLMPHGTFYK